MKEHPLNQSSWSRTRKETIHTLHSGKFWVATIIMEAILMVIAYMVTPDGSSGLTYTVIQAATFVLGMFAMVSLSLVFSLIVVPYKQRNEARNMVEQQREPSDTEVNDAIRLLQTESLVTKHNNGEEQSYSFAKVFLAIADQLSIGVSSIHFESKIRKGLGIDEKGEWYFPSEDEGITHLIGVLDQNALIDRRNEEYQHMVGGLNYFSTSIAFPTPKEHLSKGTETKYYLSSFGSRVVQQLRQQSTVHKEGSAIPAMLKSPRPPELQVSYQKHEFSVDNEVPIITVWAEYRPTGTMRIEAIELQLVGERKPSLDWKVCEVKQDIWITSDNKFKVPDGISPGEHNVTLAAFANGEWWGSQPFPIAFPEVYS